MLKATILTTIIGLLTAALTVPVWSSATVILLLVSAEVTYLGLNHQCSVVRGLADLGAIGEISYLAGAVLRA